MTNTVAPIFEANPLDELSAFWRHDAAFYREYDWALNIYPRIADTLQRLRADLRKFNLSASEMAGWQRREILTNLFLHGCTICDTVDDFLLGPAYDFSKVAIIPFAGLAIHAFEKARSVPRAIRNRRLARVHRWRREWHAALGEFLRTALIPETVPSVDLLNRLGSLCDRKLPQQLLNEVAKVPAALRSQDMSYQDVMRLGEKLVSRVADRHQPILVVGLRTAGSYFAPVLSAFLSVNGFTDVDWVTIRPKKGIAAWEQSKLSAYSRKSARAVIIDEPVNTGKTLLKTVDLIDKAGFRGRTSILIPVHPSRRDWNQGWESQALSYYDVITLDPEEWYRTALLKPASVSSLLSSWLGDSNTTVTISTDPKAESLNQRLAEVSELKFHNRLKEVYCVELSDGSNTTRKYVIAKSVGCGWYGYHAVLTAERLQGFVPPVIGFAQGLVFEGWVGKETTKALKQRDEFWQRAADYISCRTQVLRLDADPVRALAKDNRHKAVEELSGILSKAYGSSPAALLQRARLRDCLTAKDCPVPTLIDGKLRPLEWVDTPAALIKTDFEQHGLGKTELNAVDPAYDLAEAVLHWQLSLDEEKSLLARYISHTGDQHVEQRLQGHKLLAGNWQMMRAFDNLKDSRLSSRAQDFNLDYLNAWNFLIIQTLRFTGSLCLTNPQRSWLAPLVVMDIDGVIDKQIFGFPSTTAAGIRAISLLHAHGYGLALNSARSVPEIREYCQAYGMLGGVAEYGAYIWDGQTDRGEVLVSPEALEQLATLARELRKIPGVFLNDDYKYSIRAFTYSKGVTVAVPTLLIQNLMSALKLDRLTFHQTFLDTAVLSRDVDKGKGMTALLALVNRPNENTTAIGDSEPDLPMFKVARKSYAPGHISCKQAARALGCKFGRGTYQAGLLDVCRRIVHPEGQTCARCKECDALLAGNSDIFVEMLKVADSGKLPSLIKSMFSRWALAAFRQ